MSPFSPLCSASPGSAESSGVQRWVGVRRALCRRSPEEDTLVMEDAQCPRSLLGGVPAVRGHPRLLRALPKGAIEPRAAPSPVSVGTMTLMCPRGSVKWARVQEQRSLCSMPCRLREVRQLCARAALRAQPRSPGPALSGSPVPGAPALPSLWEVCARVVRARHRPARWLREALLHLHPALAAWLRVWPGAAR